MCFPLRDMTKEPFRVRDESIFSEYTTEVLNLTRVLGIFLKKKKNVHEFEPFSRRTNEQIKQ